MKTALRTLAATAAMAAALSVVPVGAQAFVGDTGAPPAGQHLKRLARELGLTPQQKQDIKAIFAKNRPQVQPLIKQMVAERRALRALVQADQVDEAAIRAQSAKVAAIQADMAVQRAQLGQEIRKVLTPEQIQKAKDLQAKRDSKRDKALSRWSAPAAPGN